MQIAVRHIMYICIFFFVLFIATIIVVYKSTKSSHYAVGYNDGTIIAKVDMIEMVKNKMGFTHFCNELPNSKLETITFIKVKAIVLYAKKYPNGQVSFCLKE